MNDTPQKANERPADEWDAPVHLTAQPISQTVVPALHDSTWDRLDVPFYAECARGQYLQARLCDDYDTMAAMWDAATTRPALAELLAKEDEKCGAE